jgi:hypothetical protein
VKTPTSPGSAQEVIAEAIQEELKTPAPAAGPPEQIALPLTDAKPANPAKFPSHEGKTSPGPGINPDLRVDVDLGATIPSAQFGNIRPALAIRGINPYTDVEGQIEVSLAAGVLAFVRINDTIGELVDDKLIESETGSTLAERVVALEAFDEKVKANITTLAAMVRRAALPETPEA